mgnify:CR=1 FL=1
MKKAMKKLMAALLAVAMVCAMAIPAWADDTGTASTGTNTLTINGTTEGHTYEAYQVFKGKLNNGVLSDIQWGDDVNGAAILIDSDLPTTLQNQPSAAALAAKLEGLGDGSDVVNTFAKVVSKYIKEPAKHTSTASGKKYTISNLPDGYYFIKDATDTMPEGATYSRYMLNIVKSMEINAKDTSVTLNKEIYHNDTSSWGVVGDNQIGDTVEFRTITKVPDTAGYTKYDYIIHDTMSAGLTSNVTSSADVTIKVNDTTVLTTEYYIVTATGNSFSATVDILQAIADGKMNANDQLYTYYTGVLNTDAKVYDEGKQDNVAYLEYSNNPHVDTEKGKTPEKKVYDWTFKMGINKVNENGGQLTGAKFALSKNGTLKVADMNCNDEGIPAVTTGLIAMVKISDGEYRVAVDGDTNVVYVVDAGNPVIKGLDDAVDYYLYETKAPAGYNLLSEPVHFKISAAYNEDGSNYTDVTVTVGAAAASNTLSANVVNKSGSTLPETGGIGTTIFYVLGSLLVVGAGVVLITRKRMGKSEN